jgi:preprotein translocase subunit SecB
VISELIPDRRVDGPRSCPAGRGMLATPRIFTRVLPVSEESPVSTTNGGEANPAPTPNLAPQLMVLAQYIKDLSFENPNAPASLSQSVQPQIQISVNVNAKPLSGPDFEVELRLEGKAEAAGSVLFNIELLFGGVFRIQNVPQENINPLVMIECPRLLFPFAREIIANTVRNGGFPPLLLDPIDFVGLYQQRIGQQMTAAPATA